MDESKPPDTRTRILETALDVFSERGYQAGSMREIADRLQLTKAAVFYHFPAKSVLLATLCEPLSEGLEDVLARARLTADRAAARRQLIEGTLDVYIQNRKLLYVIMQDLTTLAHDRAFQHYVDLIQQVHDEFTGPYPDVTLQVRTVQIFATLGDPVFLCRDVPVDRLRAEILRGAWALLDDPATSGLVARDEPEPSAARTAARRPGRPRALDEAKAEAARRMYAEGAGTVGEIAERLGVSRATLYRHLGDRTPPA
ncbi:TetR family transcriptional regulator [Actinomadura sp. GC306]|uniref:TetR family transcriptional regulator n=1 Tax=Actinomadura sp. GC306 TaxID=2530367 RepID=UPI0010492428|nr:TetR family transcriptional regulator [Actinomadura sp. GC306]TDC70219.1 TetR family transcriptional regulator [Actinomadura sp. GC306]